MIAVTENHVAYQIIFPFLAPIQRNCPGSRARQVQDHSHEGLDSLSVNRLEYAENLRKKDPKKANNAEYF